MRGDEDLEPMIAGLRRGFVWLFWWMARVSAGAAVGLIAARHLQALGAATWPLASALGGAVAGLLCRRDLPIAAGALAGLFLLTERTGADLGDWYPLWASISKVGFVQIVLTFALGPLAAFAVSAAWPLHAGRERLPPDMEPG
jgi:hypothetical protein